MAIAVGPVLPIAFTWEAFAGAIKYWLQVSQNSDFSSPAIDDSNVGTTSYSATDDELDAGVRYYWRVRALH